MKIKLIKIRYIPDMRKYTLPTTHQHPEKGKGIFPINATRFEVLRSIAYQTLKKRYLQYCINCFKV